MKNNILYKYKKELTKKHIQYDNNTLIDMLNTGRRDEVIQSLLPMVIYIVNKFNNSNEFDELVSIGNEGLLKAIDKFDITKSNNIISYCHSTIKFTIINHFNQNKNIIRLPLSKNVSDNVIKSRPTIVNIEEIDYIQLVDNNELYEEKTIDRNELKNILMSIPKMKSSRVDLFLDYYLIPNITYDILSIKNGFTKQNASLIVQDILKKIKSNPQLMDKFREILF